MSSAMGNQSFGGLSGTSFTCHNPLPGLQSCLQPDMPLNLLIASSLVCLWKRSLPLESSPAGAVFPVCWEPHALLPPGCAQGLAQVNGIPGKRGAQGWHTGTPPPQAGITSGVTGMAPWEEADTGSRQQSRAWQGWAPLSPRPDAGDAGAGG